MNANSSPRRALRATPFLLALGCFLLPFVMVSCQGQHVTKLNGYQLAFGTTVERTEPFSGRTETKKIEGDPAALGMILATALAGTLAVMGRGVVGAKLTSLTGGVALGSAVVLKIRLDEQILRQGEGMFRVEYQAGFIVCVLLLATGTGMAWWLRDTERDTS
jgi:hypothetical protein